MIPLTFVLDRKSFNYCPIRNKTQEKILIILSRNESLTAIQIARKLYRKYKTIYEELQKMLECKLLKKNKEKKYSINPKYGEYLIFTGFELTGFQNETSKKRIHREIVKICRNKMRLLITRLHVILKKEAHRC